MAGVVAVPKRFAADLLCLVLAVALASGCTTLRPVTPTATGAYTSIKPGDKLRIVTRDGRELRLVVTSVAEDSLAGNPQPAGTPPVAVAFSEIASIEKAQFSPAIGIPVGAVLVGAVVTTVVVMIYYAILAIGRSDQNPRPERGVAVPAAP